MLKGSPSRGATSSRPRETRSYAWIPIRRPAPGWYSPASTPRSLRATGIPGAPRAYWQISGGRATAGDFAGFLSALLFAAQPVRALGRLSGKLQEGLAGAESIYGLLDEVPRVVDKPGAKPLAIEDGQITFENVKLLEKK